MDNFVNNKSDDKKPKLLDQVRQIIRVKHYSMRTEESYTTWIKRFIFFHNKRHPIEMGEKEIGQYITYLAKDKESFCFYSKSSFVCDCIFV